jgi:hypothetical protein
MRSNDVPSAAAAAHAEPPPGVGDAEANAASTSRNGRSANVGATSQFSHRISGYAVDCQPLAAAAFPADDANCVPRQMEQFGQVTDEGVVGSAFHWRDSEPDNYRAVTFAGDCGFLGSRDDADVTFDAGRGGADHIIRRRPG